MKHNINPAAGAAAALSALALILMPRAAAEAAREGIDLCLTVVIPSLFPFMVLSGYVISSGMAAALGRLMDGFVRRLFHLGGGCCAAIAAGLVGGFPVGARTAAQLYQRGDCSREEAERLLAFCNNCGPAFVFGFAGGSILQDGKAGLLLFISQTAAAFAVGILTRPAGIPKAETPPLAPPAEKGAFTASVKAAFAAVLDVCSFVLFFAIVSGVLEACGLFAALSSAAARIGVPAPVTQALLRGFLEVSSGVAAAAHVEGALPLRLMLCAAIMGWSGLSVHFQVSSVIAPAGLDGRHYIKGKCLCCLLSCLIAGLLGIVFAPCPIAPPSPALSAAAAAVCLLLPAILLTIGAKDKIRGRNEGKNKL